MATPQAAAGECLIIGFRSNGVEGAEKAAEKTFSKSPQPSIEIDCEQTVETEDKTQPRPSNTSL